MAKQIPLLPVRFRLNEQVLHDYEVAVLDFPWQAAFDRFMNGIKQIRNQELDYKERPPYRQLNLNLVAFILPQTLTPSKQGRHLQAELCHLVI